MIVKTGKKLASSLFPLDSVEVTVAHLELSQGCHSSVGGIGDLLQGNIAACGANQKSVGSYAR